MPKISIAVSVGGSKIAVGAVSSAGEILAQKGEIPTPRDTAERIDALVGQIAGIVDTVDRHELGLIGVAYPECVPPPARVVIDPSTLPEQPHSITKQIREAIATQLGLETPVEVLHDAAAAILGEVSSGGTLPGTQDAVFVVWGTGIASGIVSGGGLYWTDPEIGMMTGEIGHLVVRTAAGSYEHRPSRRWDKIDPPEVSFDNWLSGPSLERRFGERMKMAGDLTLRDVNQAARGGDRLARDLIEEAGREMGRGLAPFVQYWLGRRMSFIDHIIIGSGVARLGDHVEYDGQSVLLEAIRDGLDSDLGSLGDLEYDRENVILSDMGYEREFLAFIPGSDIDRQSGSQG